MALAGSPDLSSSIHYLRALYQQKSSLKHDINVLKIQKTYRQTNSDYKELREVLNQSKILKSKLEQLHYVYFEAKQGKVQKTPQETIATIESLASEAAINLDSIGLFSLDSVGMIQYLNLLKEKYSNLREEYEVKKLKAGHNDRDLLTNSEQREKYTDIFNEIKETSERIKSLQEENQKLENKKNNIKLQRRNSIQKVKIFQKLTENALKLRSKWLFRDELKGTITRTENELDYHFQKVEKEKSRLKDFENQLECDEQYIEDYERELSDIEEYIAKLENKLDNFYRDREEAIQQSRCLQFSNIEPKEQEDSVTLSLNSLLSGFNSMRKEKDSLIQENAKLKEKLLGLFGSKL